MTLLRSPFFWLVAVALAVAVLLIVRRTTASRPWGFKELVKNPALWDEMSEAQREIDRDTEAAQHWDDNQVAQVVRHFAFDVKTSQDAWGEKRILESLGARTHPAIISIFRDASVRSKLAIPTGTDLLPEAPMNRLCDLLGEHPPSGVVELLVPFLDDPSSEIRKDAALVLGKVGTSSIIPPLRKAFSDSDQYVRSFALIGLEWAVKGERLDEQCKRELFGDLQNLIADGKNADNATGLLMEFDAKRATEFFLSPNIFTPHSKSLHEALEAMAERRIPIPRDRLLALIKELEATKLEYPHTYSLGNALRLLGQNSQAEDRPFLEARMTHAEERVAEGAAAGLLAANGLDGFQKRLWDKESSDGFSALSSAQKHYSAVSMLDEEINNGGHSQYFVNSSGDYWRDALAGLEAMGFKERAAILRDAVGKFGKTAPSTDRRIRQEQVAKLARKDGALFGALDDRYYKCAEIVEVLATRYVITNAEAFK
ncbi:MAG TPA: DUF4375 domain-containing protein [Chthoniobacteraceae bacterium]|nr:DUF4375 domain-containing protein [Chthoniobacteraceae bacterium]